MTRWWKRWPDPRTHRNPHRSGSSDLMARIAARSNPDLQRVLDAMIATRTVLRSSSVIVLNTHFQGRTLPLLEAAAGGR